MSVIVINIKNGKEHTLKTIADFKEIAKNYPNTFRLKETIGVSKKAESIIEEADKPKKKKLWICNNVLRLSISKHNMKS